MKDFDEFLGKLSLLEWHSRGLIDPGAAELLKELAQQPELVRESVGSWSPEALDRRQLRCHETSTHYKWFIYYHRQHRYRVWLHQYKSASERRRGHAEVPHNHRYSLASLVLCGGFDHHYFERSGGWLSEIPDKKTAFRTGDVYTLNWHHIHKLSHLRDHTITLIVESPAARNFSEAFYDEGNPRRFYDFVERHSRLIGELATAYG